MIRQRILSFVIAIGLFFVLGSNVLHAETLPVKANGAASKSLVESVDKIIKMMVYVDTYLLSDENVKRIEASGNYEAIAAVHRSLSDRDLIGAQINQGRFEEAYAAMKVIENRIMFLTKLAWSNESMIKEIQNRINSERAIRLVTVR